MSKHYVVGFLFDETMSFFILIQKERPLWQAGLLNGPGGKIEEGEDPVDAMAREFNEECGRSVTGWKRYCIIHTPNDSVHFFYACSTDDVFAARTMTDEKVVVAHDADLNRAVPNAKWLIEMARSFRRGEKATGFTVREVHE